MSGALWLAVLLAMGVVPVTWWLIVDWRREIRQARTAGRVAQAVIAGRGGAPSLSRKQRTRHGGGGSDPDNFPTAFLPRTESTNAADV